MFSFMNSWSYSFRKTSILNTLNLMDSTVTIINKILRVSVWASHKLGFSSVTCDVNPNSCVDFSGPVFSSASILATIFESNIVDGESVVIDKIGSIFSPGHVWFRITTFSTCYS